MCSLLQELAPKVALQQLSLPMEDLRREKGLAGLRSLAWQAEGSHLKRPRTEYMRDVRDQMTAQEQVQHNLLACQPTARMSADSASAEHALKRTGVFCRLDCCSANLACMLNCTA